jgi:protoporphyrinogen IX oxidase
MMAEYYDWIKSFHLIFVISWMVGLLYLPRLFVYHSNVMHGSPEDKMLQVMERKLLRFIMNPAMILTLIFGLWLAQIYGFKNLGGWFHIKMTLVLVLVYYHHYLGRRRKDFEKGINKHGDKFYKILNEVPSLLMVAIVIIVIVKPFQ